jgi:hypothetical protein
VPANVVRKPMAPKHPPFAATPLQSKTSTRFASNTASPPPKKSKKGRLNVLANVVRKPMAQIFSEFSGKAQKGAENEYMGSGEPHD